MTSLVAAPYPPAPQGLAVSPITLKTWPPGLLLLRCQLLPPTPQAPQGMAGKPPESRGVGFWVVFPPLHQPLNSQRTRQTDFKRGPLGKQLKPVNLGGFVKEAQPWWVESISIMNRRESLVANTGMFPR